MHKRPKFGHNLVCKRHKIFYAWTTKIFLWAIDENMGTNMQAFYKHFYICCLKTPKKAITFCKNKTKLFLLLFFLNSGRARVNRAGRKAVRAGRSALRNGPSWNTDDHCGTRTKLGHCEFRVMTPTALVALSRTPVCVGSGHHPCGLGPQGAGARRERDARSDDDAPRLRPPPVAQGGAHRRLPAHDHTDGGAHRDPAGARRGGKTRCADQDGSLWRGLEVSGRPAGATVICSRGPAGSGIFLSNRTCVVMVFLFSR